jgi:hypothetical protein
MAANFTNYPLYFEFGCKGRARQAEWQKKQGLCRKEIVENLNNTH